MECGDEEDDDGEEEENEDSIGTKVECDCSRGCLSSCRLSPTVVCTNGGGGGGACGTEEKKVKYMAEEK